MRDLARARPVPLRPPTSRRRVVDGPGIRGGLRYRQGRVWRCSSPFRRAGPIPHRRAPLRRTCGRGVPPARSSPPERNRPAGLSVAV